MGIFNVSERHRMVRTKILIARNVRYTQEDLRDVLIHEMIHLLCVPGDRFWLKA